MTPVVRKVPLGDLPPGDRGDFGNYGEWLVTNGLGGYASGTVAGPMTRRYHGLLIAAMPAPLGRVVMLNGLVEHLHLENKQPIQLNPPTQDDAEQNTHSGVRTEFQLESGLPVWRYQHQDCELVKRLHLRYRQNTVQITYQLISCRAPVEISLRPLIQFREHEANVDIKPAEPYVLTIREDTFEITAGALPALRMLLYGRAELLVQRRKIERVRYPYEEARGYKAFGDLWTPGLFRIKCAPHEEISFIASTEDWEVIHAMDPREAWNAERGRRDRLLAQAHPKARTGVGAELVLAADQFIATPAGRLVDSTRSLAAGDEMRTVMAGYHWFTDWGRDTMISLEGLTLTTGRYAEAAWILRNFANSVRDGLIPNLFPEGSREGLYHTADATLWFFHAVDRYLQATQDRWTLRLFLPKLVDIVECHFRGTRFGIAVDPDDALLRQGEENYQLTWMDAKVGDWIVTPRRGKAVEINALWYNALRLIERWLSEEGDNESAQRMHEQADRVRSSFNRRFWCAAKDYLYDVIDGPEDDDDACRPNQILAISLPHPVLDREKWPSVLHTVCRDLLTPLGLRTLAPQHRDYKPNYFGDLRARDAAYHQGTVWAWLIGPLIDARLKVQPDDRAGARKLLEAFIPHLNRAGIGSISEIFDATAPFTPRGCIAQAWSVAEVLRCWVKTAQ